MCRCAPCASSCHRRQLHSRRYRTCVIPLFYNATAVFTKLCSLVLVFCVCVLLTVSLDWAWLLLQVAPEGLLRSR
jgi:hypothetical protein